MSLPRKTNLTKSNPQLTKANAHSPALTYDASITQDSLATKAPTDTKVEIPPEAIIPKVLIELGCNLTSLLILFPDTSRNNPLIHLYHSY
ncbi:hypothetical protein A3H89_03425 [Candidatus Amesbacteria bacterium RIFCSPLOWO2_02_FULL_48_11]|nr:MAG: hypothetical protein A2354_01435 [Candidatus Amesbacteria bacterium RIFOXYB1_FULL_47_12]OGD07716.1 MAG: hypothetical protein A3H89_03425 [Candidatus Amesbacteria bacterium RIFCSPLOWO2_02_FULL_48_11]